MPYSDAAKEAFALAPKSVVVYDTLEIQHAQDPSLFLVNAIKDKQFRLEDNTLVTYKSIPFTVTLPKSGEGGNFSMQIRMTNYMNLVSNYLQTVIGSNNKIKAIYRPYLSNDTTLMPQLNPPISLYISGASIDKTEVVAQASFSDIVNKKVPTVRYDPNIFTNL